MNVALPTLGAELRAHVDALQWIVNGYLLAITATLVMMGRLGDRLGHRALYAGGLVVFTLRLRPVRCRARARRARRGAGGSRRSARAP